MTLTSVYMYAYVDTGADVNLISKNRYVKLHNDETQTYHAKWH